LHDCLPLNDHLAIDWIRVNRKIDIFLIIFRLALAHIYRAKKDDLIRFFRLRSAANRAILFAIQRGGNGEPGRFLKQHIT
jgi:hypothetical protein